MMTVNIITVGKLKEKYLRDACDEYIKRLKAFCKINVLEISEYRLSENPSLKEIDQALSNEAKAMEQYSLLNNCYNITMCIEGKQISSENLSEKIEKISLMGKSTINLFIGSSFGLEENFKEKSDFKMSMSMMTFPHQLARIMVLEQIYRAFQILNNGKYHK